MKSYTRDRIKDFAPVTRLLELPESFLCATVASLPRGCSPRASSRYRWRTRRACGYAWTGRRRSTVAPDLEAGPGPSLTPRVQAGCRRGGAG